MEIVAAHASVGGTGPGRRYATQQINHAYAMLLASRFQAFSRDLHSEVADHFANAAPARVLRDVARERLLEGRQLDKWRNGLAHQDPDKFPTGETLGLQDVARFRSVCSGLVSAMDRVMRAHLRVVARPLPVVIGFRHGRHQSEARPSRR